MPRRTTFHVFLPVAALLVLACCSDDTPTDSTPAKEARTFPAGFLFGAATAGFQVDMGCPTLPTSTCTDPSSDWYAFATSPDMIADPENHLSGQAPEVSPGHWELYEQDFDRLRDEVHGNAFRMSIEWSRIFPTPTDGIEGHAALAAVASAPAIQHYHEVFAALRARGITPLVTLNHYTLPTWIHDAVGCHQDLATCSPRGWLDADRTVHEIAKYAGFVADEFGGDVDLWATENEPFAVVLPGYIFPTPQRTNPPAVSLAFTEAKIVMNALIQAHARMYDAIEGADTADADGDGDPAVTGLVYAMTPMTPHDPENELDVLGAKNLFYLWNMVFLNAVAKGDLDADMTGDAVHQADLENRMDYIGVNYYVSASVIGATTPFFPELSPLSTFNPLTIQQTTSARGIYDMIQIVHRDLGLPVIVTENGVTDPEGGAVGSAFITQHLSWVSRAVRDGADVRGYFYWSLMDNYEWNSGMDDPQYLMGLYAVDKDDPTKARVARSSVATYASIIDALGIPEDLAAKYPAD